MFLKICGAKILIRLKENTRKRRMTVRVMRAENWDIIKLLAQVLPNIIKRKIRKFTRRNEKAPMVVEPIWRGKKRKITPFQISVQARSMCQPMFDGTQESESSQVYIFNPDDGYSYSELSKMFNNMYVDSINAFKKILSKKK